MNVGSISTSLELDLQKFKAALNEAAKMLARFQRQFKGTFKLDINTSAIQPLIKMLGKMNSSLHSIKKSTKDVTESMTRGFNEVKLSIDENARALAHYQSRIAAVSRKKLGIYF